MSELLKIRDVSAKYDVSARTLRYYEDMGLILSTRSDDYAYRLYDGTAIKRLEQILILRKLNISIKDIRRIFDHAGTEVVLEVLNKKVDDIDDEVSLLHELKAIVLSFIRQINSADFSREQDVKSLYAKAKEIEAQLTGYDGNPAPAHRLFEVAEKLEAKAASRLQIPDNVLKRMLENVYFILGDGAAVADELGRRYGIYVYHTCDYRQHHAQHADPKYQPELCREVPDFFALDPQDAMHHERNVVHDYTPMVIMDLIRLTAQHDKIICENDIDIDSIIGIISHGVMITNGGIWDAFCDSYARDIQSRDMPESDKARRIDKLDSVWGAGKPEHPRGANPYGLKQLYMDAHTNIEQLTADVATYFGL